MSLNEPTENGQKMDGEQPSTSQAKVSRQINFKAIFQEESQKYLGKSEYLCEGKIRTQIYRLLANSVNVRERCSALRTALIEYLKNTIIPVESRFEDFLGVLLNKYGKLSIEDQYEMKYRRPIEFRLIYNPLFPTIKLECNTSNTPKLVANAHQLQKIGYQNIFFSEQVVDPQDTDDTDDSNSDTDNEPMTPKRRKILLKTKPYDSVDFANHNRNLENITTSQCHVDILILIEPQQCVPLATHLGLIYLDNLITKNEVEGMAKRHLLQKKKLYRHLQPCINKCLMKGLNNICLTSSVGIWDYIKANARAVIRDEQNPDMFLKASESADFVVSVQNDILDYIEAVGQIINASVCSTVTIPAKYEVDEKEYGIVNLPITAVIPLYIIRYFTQSYLVKTNWASRSPTDIFMIPDGK